MLTKSEKVQNVYKMSYPIHLSLNNTQMINIVKKYYSNDNTIDYLDLIKKSNHNFHSIQINLQVYKEKTQDIKVFQKNYDELFMLIKKLYHRMDIDEIYRSSVTDNSIISLNILENCVEWVFLNKKLSLKKKLTFIHQIYLSNCISDNYHIKIHKLNNWDISEHMITQGILLPLYYLSKGKIKMQSMIYNKYLSRSIIYTFNSKLLYSYEINYQILSCLYSLFLNKEYEKVHSYIKRYHINKKIFEKFIKYYTKKYSKNDSKLLFHR